MNQAEWSQSLKMAGKSLHFFSRFSDASDGRRLPYSPWFVLLIGQSTSSPYCIISERETRSRFLETSFTISFSHSQWEQRLTSLESSTSWSFTLESCRPNPLINEKVQIREEKDNQRINHDEWVESLVSLSVVFLFLFLVTSSSVLQRKQRKQPKTHERNQYDNNGDLTTKGDQTSWTTHTTSFPVFMRFTFIRILAHVSRKDTLERQTLVKRLQFSWVYWWYNCSLLSYLKFLHSALRLWEQNCVLTSSQACQCMSPDLSSFTWSCQMGHQTVLRNLYPFHRESFWTKMLILLCLNRLSEDIEDSTRRSIVNF